MGTLPRNGLITVIISGPLEHWLQYGRPVESKKYNHVQTLVISPKKSESNQIIVRKIMLLLFFCKKLRSPKYYINVYVSGIINRQYFPNAISRIPTKVVLTLSV